MISSVRRNIRFCIQDTFNVFHSCKETVGELNKIGLITILTAILTLGKL